MCYDQLCNLLEFHDIKGSDYNVGTGTGFVTIIISLQIYTYCTCYFGEDYLVVKTWKPGLSQYDI